MNWTLELLLWDWASDSIERKKEKKLSLFFKTWLCFVHNGYLRHRGAMVLQLVELLVWLVDY